jgi:membrane-associated phospholipid phosphatase
MGRVFTRDRVLRQPIDITFYAVNLYLAAVSVVVTLAGAAPPARHLPAAAGFILACALPAVLSVVEERLTSGLLRGPARFARTFYIHAFYGPYFAQVILLSQAVSGGASLDALVARMEAAIFGGQPALTFSAGLSQLPLVNEVFFFGYFSYYLIITSGFWILFVRGREEAARRGVFIATTSFALLYVWYTFVPVQGPKYFFETLNAAWYAEFEGVLFVPIMRTIFNNMNLAGAAFPSSHVAIGLLAVVLIRRELPRLFRVYLAIFGLLCLSTVYIYAHYAIDAVAGIAVVPVLLLAVRPLERRAREVVAAQSHEKGGVPG